MSVYQSSSINKATDCCDSSYMFIWRVCWGSARHWMFFFFFFNLPLMPGPFPAADGLISYSAPEGQLMMPPGYPIASLNDSTYDGAHERRRVTHALCTHGSFSILNVCDWLLSRPIGSCLGGWASWRTVWSAWTTSCWHVSTTCGRATTTWAGGTTRWALRDTWRWSLSSTDSGTSPPWRF